MRKLQFFLFFGFILTINTVFAQTEQIIAKDTLNKGSINEQFDFVMRKSSNFKNYKVVKRVWLNKIKKHINDSLSTQKTTIKTANNQIVLLQANIKDLESKIVQLNETLDASNSEKNSIDFLGMRIKKQQYKLIMWAIVAVLLMGLLFFIYSYKNSHKVTKESLAKLKEVEEEYSGFRARSLEREQALNRKLLDEINKHK